MAAEESNDQNEIWTLNKRCNWSSCSCSRVYNLSSWPDSLACWGFSTKFKGRWFKLHLGQLSIATFKNPLVESTTCISSFLYTLVIEKM